MTISIFYEEMTGDGEWIIADETVRQPRLEGVSTRQEAINRSRNKWAAPGQKIEIHNRNGVGWETIREGDGGGGGSGGMGGGIPGL